MPYTRTQIRLHWIVFGLIALQYVLHDPMAEAWEKMQDGIEVAFSPLVAAHVAGGAAVLVLVVWRLVLRRRHGAPPLPGKEPLPLRITAHATHAALYALMILMPLSGMAAWFGGGDTAAEVHVVLRIVLLALIGLHIAGALYHQFVLKTNLMNRMRNPSSP